MHNILFLALLLLSLCMACGNPCKCKPSEVTISELQTQLQNIDDQTFVENKKDGELKDLSKEEFIKNASKAVVNDRLFQPVAESDVSTKATSEGHRKDCEALRDCDYFNYTSKAFAIVVQGDVETDYYFWGLPAAHAQTPDGIKPDESDKLINAQRTFCKWVDDNLLKAVQFAKNKQYGDALYWFGISLHAIQDIEYHKGMNNIEHGYSLVKPDARPDKTAESSMIATVIHYRRFLKLLEKEVGAEESSKISRELAAFNTEYEGMKECQEEYVRRWYSPVEFFLSGLQYKTEKHKLPRWKSEDGKYSECLEFKADGKSYQKIYEELSPEIKKKLENSSEPLTTDRKTTKNTNVALMGFPAY